MLAQYTNDDAFLKIANCPLRMNASDLARLPELAADMHSFTCEKNFRCAGGMTDKEIKLALDVGEDLRDFSWPAPKHVAELGQVAEASAKTLPVIRMACSIPAMEDRFSQGFRLVVKQAGPGSGVGSKCRLF